MMKCSVCSAEYSSNFCPDCGSAQPVATQCARCGASHTNNYCPNCGTSAQTLAYREEVMVQEVVQPQEIQAVPPRPLAQPQQSYPPGGTYPPPPKPEGPLPQVQVLQPAAAGGAMAMPSIVVNNTSLTGDAVVGVNLTQPGAPGMAPYYAQKSKLLCFFLCFFFGFMGIHRFYVGKIGTGILWLLTGGMFFFGWFIDLITILTGAFKDAAGQPLQI